MKCVIKNNVIERVSDKRAKYLTEKLGYSYAPKSLWKKANTEKLPRKSKVERKVK